MCVLVHRRDDPDNCAHTIPISFYVIPIIHFPYSTSDASLAYTSKCGFFLSSIVWCFHSRKCYVWYRLQDDSHYVNMITSANGNIFRVNWPFVPGIHWSPVNSPHKGQWRGALMFSLICAWANGRVSNPDAGDLGHHDDHVTSLWCIHLRHNQRQGISNHRHLDCLLIGWFSRPSKKISKLRVTGLCEGNPPLTGGFPLKMASNAENASIWWRHHGYDFFARRTVTGWMTCTWRSVFRYPSIPMSAWLSQNRSSTTKGNNSGGEISGSRVKRTL